MTVRASVDLLAAKAPRRDLAENDGVDVIAPIPRDVLLDDGKPLGDGHVRLRRYGRADAPVVVVAGGISSGRRVAGEGGWWRRLVGADAAIDLDEFCVLGFDFAPLDDVRVVISPATQARLLTAAFDALRIERLHAFIGASYGGMVGLALAAAEPQRLRHLCVISAAHKPAPLAHAWRSVQRRIVEFGIAHDRAEEGLALARELAMITYRSGAEFAERFRCAIDKRGISDLGVYLAARGRAYPAQMPPRRWLSLSEAIDRCNVTPEGVATPATLVASASDQLVPIEDMRTLAARLPHLAALHVLPSLYGHDAFLKEAAQLTPIIRRCLTEDAHG
ncbi:MAG: homoserine O-succinyltransferase [Proteobacteria bacterium]|nr:homoserine O-succinyltransferase [Pseudomonadota bacterium]